MTVGIDRERALEIGARVLHREAQALEAVAGALDGTFTQVLEAMMACEGKVVFVGMGKSGHIARKVAATAASLGTCSICLHPGECMHGDLGMIQRRDLVVLISHSGESDEILQIIPGIGMIGARTVGITGNPASTLARSCDIVQILPGIEEACRLGLAPTSSTTAVLGYGDALAVAASELKGFTRRDFGAFHPAGSLGKGLTLRVTDVMRPLGEGAIVAPSSTLADAIIAISESGADILLVTDGKGRLAGIVTNGDIKRSVQSGADIRSVSVSGLVHRYPVFVDRAAMAVDALRIATDRGVATMPVVSDDVPVGTVSRADILERGVCL